MTVRTGNVVRIGGNLYIVTGTDRASRTVEGQYILDMVSATATNCSASFPYRVDEDGKVWITIYSNEGPVECEATFVAANVREYITGRPLQPFPELG